MQFCDLKVPLYIDESLKGKIEDSMAFQEFFGFVSFLISSSCFISTNWNEPMVVFLSSVQHNHTVNSVIPSCHGFLGHKGESLRYMRSAQYAIGIRYSFMCRNGELVYNFSSKRKASLKSSISKSSFVSILGGYSYTRYW